MDCQRCAFETSCVFSVHSYLRGDSFYDSSSRFRPPSSGPSETFCTTCFFSSSMLLSKRGRPWGIGVDLSVTDLSLTFRYKSDFTYSSYEYRGVFHNEHSPWVLSVFFSVPYKGVSYTSSDTYSICCFCGSSFYYSHYGVRRENPTAHHLHHYDDPVVLATVPDFLTGEVGCWILCE